MNGCYLSVFRLLPPITAQLSVDSRRLAENQNKTLTTYPNRDMLERLIRTTEEPNEIRMKTAIGPVPNGVEWCIVFRG